MATLYDISEWTEQNWWNTGGTRDKKIYLNPNDGYRYFFKQSLNKEKKNYTHEFWSEILASEIGRALGFNVLQYDIAINRNLIGCISKSMIEEQLEELSEGGKYLQAFDNTFNPEDKKLRYKYDFQLIQNSLNYFEKQHYLKDLTEIIVFDALIGNSDRHQENWALIVTHSKITESIAKVENGIRTGELKNYSFVVRKILTYIYTIRGKIRPEFQVARLIHPKQDVFAPIYDSGCSFGRELSNDRVSKMLGDRSLLENYIMGGKSEIHWNQNKVNHFKLLEHILSDETIKNHVLLCLKRVLDKFDNIEMKKIISNIDKPLIKSNDSNIFPEERKELVLELLNLRLSKIREIHSQHS